MTPEALEKDWLSLRYWLMACVLPTAMFLLVVLGILKAASDTAHELDHKAVIAAFFALYFILVRGGHIVMMRSLHKELLAKYEGPYRDCLAPLDPAMMKKCNIGFTLARMKRELASPPQKDKA